MVVHQPAFTAVSLTKPTLYLLKRTSYKQLIWFGIFIEVALKVTKFSLPFTPTLSVRAIHLQAIQYAYESYIINQFKFLITEGTWFFYQFLYDRYNHYKNFVYSKIPFWVDKEHQNKWDNPQVDLFVVLEVVQQNSLDSLYLTSLEPFFEIYGHRIVCQDYFKWWAS